MANIQEFLDNILQHAAPKYYDPVKAHEYYERTKELKGRKSMKGLSSKQREAFDFSKSEINKAKDQDVDAARAEKEAKLEEIHQTAERLRGEIREKLRAILERLSVKREETQDKIAENRREALAKINDQLRKDLKLLSDDTEQKLDALPPLPRRATQAQRDARSAKIAQIKGAGQTVKDELRAKASAERETVNNKASEERTAVSNETANQKNLQRESSTSEREKVTADVKAAVDDARANYETLKADLKAKYEEEIDSEFDAIKQTVR